MKIEFEIGDINRDEVIGAMAERLLNTWSSDDQGNAYSRRSELGEALGRAVKERINAIAESMVREKFDAVIADRITSAVDAVLADGWYETDSYGGRKGDRHDLKARISKALTEPRRDSGGYSRKPSILDERLDEAIKAALNGEFAEVIKKATTDLRARLDATVTQKVAEAIKSALGVK